MAIVTNSANSQIPDPLPTNSISIDDRAFMRPFILRGYARHPPRRLRRLESRLTLEYGLRWSFRPFRKNCHLTYPWSDAIYLMTLNRTGRITKAYSHTVLQGNRTFTILVVVDKMKLLARPASALALVLLETKSHRLNFRKWRESKLPIWMWEQYEETEWSLFLLIIRPSRRVCSTRLLVVTLLALKSWIIGKLVHL